MVEEPMFRVAAGRGLFVPLRGARAMRPTVLVIAGSDSSGGAGLQADTRALDHIAVQAATAVTAVTSQNSLGVRSVYPMTPGAVLDQASQVLDDVDISVVKCGMLYS